RRGHRHLRPQPHREPRRALPRRLPRSQRRRVAQTHPRLQTTRRLHRDRLQTSGHHQLSAAGTGVLMNADFRIQRYDPEKDEKPYYQTFSVEVEDTDRVLDGLNKIKWYQDGSLTYRRSCAHGICGSDAMRINGVNALACKVLMK